MTVSMSAVVVAEAVLLDGGECQVLSKYGHVYYIVLAPVVSRSATKFCGAVRNTEQTPL